MNCCTKLTERFLSHLYLNSLPLLTGKEEPKGKGTMGCPVFYAIIFSVSSQLIKGSNRNKKRQKEQHSFIIYVSWNTIAFSYVGDTFLYKWSMASRGCQCPVFFIGQLTLDLLWVSLNSHGSWIHWSPVFRGYHKYYMWTGGKKSSFTYCLHARCSHSYSFVPLDFIEQKFKTTF